jgi:hypothetical protein
MATLPRGVFFLMKQVLINPQMIKRRNDLTKAECMELEMTEAQREVFLIIDQYWKEFGFSPSIRDICLVRKKSGLGNTSEIVNRLVKLGVLKKLKGRRRTIRPVYINFAEYD